MNCSSLPSSRPAVAPGGTPVTSLLPAPSILSFVLASLELAINGHLPAPRDVHPKSWTVNNRYLHVLTSVLHRTQPV